MIVARTGRAAVDALTSAGVRSLVLKGLATAHLDYPEPSWRELGDIDLLVHPDDLDAADAAMSTIADPVEPVSEALRLRNKERVFVDPSGVEIDLHHRLLEDPYGFAVRLEELFATSETFGLNGTEAAAPCAAHRLAHAVAHWASSGPAQQRASTLVDITLLCARPGVAQEARRTLARWSLGCLTEDLPELTGTGERDRSRVLGSLFARAHQGSRIAAELGAVAAQPSAGAAARDLWNRLSPTDELMALHGVTRTHRLARFAWRALSRGNARS